MINTLKQTDRPAFIWNHIAILLIVWIAFFLRTYQLDSQALRGDESATVLYSAMPINELWELSRLTDPHPPLYYAMLHPWQWVMGEEGWLMRFAGVMASALSVATLYKLTNITLKRASLAWLAAGLLALNPLQIWLAQDVRSYPFFTLFGLLSSWALWAALNPIYVNFSPPAPPEGGESECIPPSGGLGGLKPDPKLIHMALNPTPAHPTPWLLYIFFTVVCLYTHYYTVFLIACQGLFVLFNSKRYWSKKWIWLVSQIIILILIIPGLQLAYNFIGQAAGGIDTIPTSTILRRASTALLTGFTIADSWGLWLSLLLMPIWIIGMIALVRHNYTSGTFWTLFFLVPVLGIIALSIDRPFFKERFLIQAQPAFALLLATGFSTLWHTSPRPTFHVLQIIATTLFALLLTANTLALSNYFTHPDYLKAPPWNLYNKYVSKKSNPGDVMLTNFPEASVSYYSPNQLPFYVVPVERDRSVAYRLEQTEQIANAYRRIWFLPLLRQGFDEQGDVLTWLDRHADRVNQVFFPVYNINLYLSPTAIDQILIPYPISFTHGINLRGYQILDDDGESAIEIAADTPVIHTKPDDQITLSLYWQGNGPTPEPYTVFTHLIAADGFTITSHDNEPVWGSYPTTTWLAQEKITDKYTLTVPPGTGPGNYKIRLGWYQPTSQTRVLVSGTIDDHIILDLIIRVE